MRIYQVSAAMFEAFGAEDKLIASFQRHHNNILHQFTRKQIKDKLANDKTLILGKMRIGEILDEVFQRHGEPKFKDWMPRTIVFAIKMKLQGQTINAYIHVKDRVVYFVKLVDDPYVITFPEEVRDTFRHEFQHIIRDIYTGGAKPEYQMSDMGGKNYYADQGEIQAFSLNIAVSAMRDLEDFYRDYYNKINDPVRIEKLIQKQMNDQALKSAINLFLMSYLSAIIKHLRKNDQIRDENTVKTYYKSTIRNFTTLYNKFWNDWLLAVKK